MTFLDFIFSLFQKKISKTPALPGGLVSMGKRRVVYSPAVQPGLVAAGSRPGILELTPFRETANIGVPGQTPTFVPDSQSAREAIDFVCDGFENHIQRTSYNLMQVITPGLLRTAGGIPPGGGRYDLKNDVAFDFEWFGYRVGKHDVMNAHRPGVDLIPFSIVEKIMDAAGYARSGWPSIIDIAGYIYSARNDSYSAEIKGVSVSEGEFFPIPEAVADIRARYDFLKRAYAAYYKAYGLSTAGIRYATPTYKIVLEFLRANGHGDPRDYLRSMFPVTGGAWLPLESRHVSSWTLPARYAIWRNIIDHKRPHLSFERWLKDVYLPWVSTCAIDGLQARNLPMATESKFEVKSGKYLAVPVWGSRSIRQFSGRNRARGTTQYQRWTWEQSGLIGAKVITIEPGRTTRLDPVISHKIRVYPPIERSGAWVLAFERRMVKRMWGSVISDLETDLQAMLPDLMDLVPADMAGYLSDTAALIERGVNYGKQLKNDGEAVINLFRR